MTGWVDPLTDECPPLRGDVRCEVAVLGGGYTGMTATRRLAERGVDVVLVEAAFCGRGASSRNAGHLTPTIAGDPQILATFYRRRAPELIRFADHAVDFSENLVTALGADCDYERTGNVSAALTRGQLRRAERITAVLRRCGGEVEFVEGSGAGLPEAFLGGILERKGGILNPGKLARGLRSALVSSGVRVFERTPATAVTSRGNEVWVSTPGGRVRAGRVLLATNAYSRDLSFSPRRAVAPLWVTLAETEPVDPEQLEATGWTSRSGVYTQHVILENYRPTASGSIVFGTRQVQAPRGALGDRTPDGAVVDDLTRGFHERFPSLRGVPLRRAWGGWIAMTPSWLPVVGQVAPNVFYALGYNGHGLAQAPYLGALMADHLAGDPTHDDLAVVWRERARFAPAPLFGAPALRLGWAIDRLFDRFARRCR